MKEITIIARNDVGALAIVAEALGSVGVNIEAISAYGSDSTAVFRVLTNDVATATKALGKFPQFKLSEAETVVYRMINRPGELGKITRKLSNRGINLESMYIVSKQSEYTEVAICPSTKDVDKVKEILGIK
ncbi:MAG: ACT domain-containing protein [Candidatus Micrarchaeota archaeon]